MPVNENGVWYTSNAVSVPPPRTPKSSATGWKTRYAIETSTDDLADMFSGMNVSTPNSTHSASSWVTPNAISTPSRTEYTPEERKAIMKELFDVDSNEELNSISPTSGSPSEYDPHSQNHQYEADFIDDTQAVSYGDIRENVKQIATEHLGSQISGAGAEPEGIEFDVGGIDIVEPMRPVGLPPYLSHFGLNMIVGGN